MSPAAGQQWARRIRPGYTADLNMRVSDADRSAVAERLGRHFADGRLDQAEFDERTSRALAAKTRGDLAGIFEDLPDLPDDAADDRDGGGPASPAPSRPALPRRRGRRHPVLMWALVIVACIASWNVIGWGHFWFHPILWPVILLVILVLAARNSRRFRR